MSRTIWKAAAVHFRHFEIYAGENLRAETYLLLVLNQDLLSISETYVQVLAESFPCHSVEITRGMITAFSGNSLPGIFFCESVFHVIDIMKLPDYFNHMVILDLRHCRSLVKGLRKMDGVVGLRSYFLSDAPFGFEIHFDCFSHGDVLKILVLM